MKSMRPLLLSLGLLVFTAPAMCAGILSSEAAMTASPEELMAEVAVFKSIRQAFSLSVARCETTSACDATATTSEVQQVIDALDARVEGLGLRQQEAGNSAGLEDVIVAYADERGGLTRVLRKVDDLTSDVVENIDESELFGDDAGEGGNADQFGDVFADEDEEI